MSADIRRIYYDKESGLKLVEIGFKGKVVPSTIEKDINDFTALSERNRDTFDVLELPFGAYAQDFAESNGYRVNPETKELEFSRPDPSDPDAEPVYHPPLSEEVAGLKQENKLLKAQSQANSNRADFQEELIVELAMLLYS